MKIGSVFAGIGGFDLGLERAGMETKWQVEIDDYATRILEKHWPHVKRYRDVREVGAHNLEPVDLICGGFPCQPFSVAGKQKGAEDDRHLWPEMFRIIQELKPRWVIGENVAGFISMGLDDCLSDLEGEGYECQTFIIPACAVNAPHRRDRVWIVGYFNEDGKPIMPFNDETFKLQKSTRDNNGERREGIGKETLQGEPRIPWSQNERVSTVKWERPDLYPSKLCRSRNGISERLDTLGNAVVPQILEIIGRAIMEIEKI